MAYIQSEREEFVRRMKGAIRQAKQDETPVRDHSFTDNPPMSTYTKNLEKLYQLTKQYLQKGEEPNQVLSRIVDNLLPPYQDFTRKRIEEFQSAGAAPQDVIDALIEAYEQT